METKKLSQILRETRKQAEEEVADAFTHSMQIIYQRWAEKAFKEDRVGMYVMPDAWEMLSESDKGRPNSYKPVPIVYGGGSIHACKRSYKQYECWS